MASRDLDRVRRALRPPEKRHDQEEPQHDDQWPTVVGMLALEVYQRDYLLRHVTGLNEEYGSTKYSTLLYEVSGC